VQEAPRLSAVGGRGICYSPGSVAALPEDDESESAQPPWTDERSAIRRGMQPHEAALLPREALPTAKSEAVDVSLQISQSF